MDDLGIKVAFISLATPHPYGLLNITDDSHLLYSSDYPYAFANFIQGQKEKLDKTKLLTKKQKKKVYKDNFELLFDLK